MPFKSESQRRFMWSQHPDIAEKWAHGQHARQGNHRMPSRNGPDVRQAKKSNRSNRSNRKGGR